MKSYLFLLIWACFLGFSCEEANNDPAPSSSVAGDLPLLNSGQHLGMIVGFNPSNPAATTDSIEARWQEAVQAGMSIGRVQIDWPELEPEPGEYDKGALQGVLEDLENQGLQPFLTLAAYDSEGPVVPNYLEGISFDDPQISTQFALLMDWVIPMLVEYQGWAITISNEPDNAFAEEPGLADEILVFLRNSRTHIHQINDEMAVTVTFNIGNLAQSRANMQKLRDEMDVASFNIYGSGLFPIDRPYSPQEIREEIDAILDFTGEQNVIFQEVGMHTNQPLLNSSEEIQKTFFTTFFQAMENEPRMKAAYVFQLVDWSTETIEFFNTLYEPGTPQSFIDQYSAVLASLGLIQYENGQRKAAWNEFIQWIETFSQTQ
ncbi:MAG: hypothetical protein AAF632_04060 [Bacteroidota bacterium]